MEKHDIIGFMRLRSEDTIKLMGKLKAEGTELV